MAEEVARFAVADVITIESRTAHGVAPDGIQLDGQWVTEAAVAELPVGTIVVSGEQRMLRLAAQLLEPTSNDGLFTYEVLGVENGDFADIGPECPVLQLLSPPTLVENSRL